MFPGVLHTNYRMLKSEKSQEDIAGTIFRTLTNSSLSSLTLHQPPFCQSSNLSRSPTESVSDSFRPAMTVTSPRPVQWHRLTSGGATSAHGFQQVPSSGARRLAPTSNRQTHTKIAVSGHSGHPHVPLLSVFLSSWDLSPPKCKWAL